MQIISNMHSLKRTSKKGTKFVGTCVQCGKTKLTLKNMEEICSNPLNITQDDAVIKAIDGKEWNVVDAEYFYESYEEIK